MRYTKRLVYISQSPSVQVGVASSDGTHMPANEQQSVRAAATNEALWPFVDAVGRQCILQKDRAGGVAPEIVRDLNLYLHHEQGHMASHYVDPLRWASFPFHMSPSSPSVLSCLARAPSWESGYRVNVDECVAMGMSNRWVDTMRNGVDLMLDRLPIFDIARSNYSGPGDSGCS